MLASIESRAVLQQELEHSRDRIEKEIGSTPIAISYPIGSVNDIVVEGAKRTGYQLGLATGQRACDTAANADPFRIPRIELYNESWWKTRMRISGHLETIKRWIRH